MTAADPQPPEPSAPRTVTVRTLMRNIIVAGALVAIAIGTVAAVIGALVASLAGVWAAAIGALAAFVFFAITSVTMYFTAESSPTAMAAGVLGAFLVKIVAFMGVGVLLRGQDFYDPWVLFLTLAAAAICSLIADVVIVQRSRLPLVDESGAS
ncbi:hypothetical protein [Brevibacterium album]|uniref:hypothetical protein n=1 Tax=Brevibacterium album TaxID=417948 RepID=UPI00042A72FF|nr:hypothetical protein [Brevibacterium album]